jgi:23S rRNA pseudouridine1911/1915/1917 synthase
MVRFVVGPQDGQAVREVLVRLGADKDAIHEGRVFVGRKRARSDGEPVREGDVIQVAAPSRTPPPDVRVLLVTRELAVVDKPAGISTIADQRGAAHALVATLARILGVRAAGLHSTSRLDRDVSGVVVFARTKAARQRLARARVEGAYERHYVAISAPTPLERGTWNAPIGRAKDPRLRSVEGPAAIPAMTRFCVCARAPGGAALLAVAPITGRTHQIRVHAAHAGAALLGDRAYGGPTRVALPGGRVIALTRIALHAARVVVPDEAGGSVTLEAAVPQELAALWGDLGGSSDAWELATKCALG